MSNNSSDHDDLLLDALEVRDASGFTTLLILEIVTAIVALLPNSLLLYVLFCTTVFPLNLRLLLGHLSLNLIWYAAAFGVKAVSILSILVGEQNSDDLITNAYFCKLSELTNTIPLQNTVYTSLALCLERLYSTVWYQKYEKQHSKPYLAFVFIPLIWCVTLANQLNSLFTIEPTKELAVCESLISTTANSALLILTLNLSCETLCVLLTVIVYLWNNIKLRNMTINRAQQTLGARFQISQNVQLNTMMMPSMVLQSLCYLPNYIFLFFVIFGLDDKKFHTSFKVILIHCNYLWKLFYSLLHPIVAFLSKAKLFDHLKKHSAVVRVFNRALRRVKPGTTETTQRNKPDDALAHFEVLNQMWTAKAEAAAHNANRKYNAKATK